MVAVWEFGQDSEATYDLVVYEAPAGSTLVAAELSATTSFQINGTDADVPGFAPPNTLLGISWAAHGTSIPYPTFANADDALWFRVGFGDTVDTSGEVTIFPDGNWSIVRNYTTKLRWESPNQQADAYDLGIAWNWLGGGYYDVTGWVTYDFRAWIG